MHIHDISNSTKMLLSNALWLGLNDGFNLLHYYWRELGNNIYGLQVLFDLSTQHIMHNLKT